MGEAKGRGEKGDEGKGRKGEREKGETEGSKRRGNVYHKYLIPWLLCRLNLASEVGDAILVFPYSCCHQESARGGDGAETSP